MSAVPFHLGAHSSLHYRWYWILFITGFVNWSFISAFIILYPRPSPVSHLCFFFFFFFFFLFLFFSFFFFFFFFTVFPVFSHYYLRCYFTLSFFCALLSFYRIPFVSMLLLLPVWNIISPSCIVYIQRSKYHIIGTIKPGKVWLTSVQVARFFM